MKFTHHRIWRSMVAAWIGHARKGLPLKGISFYSQGGLLLIGKLEVGG
jgi:hypothetical protein